MEHCRIDQEHKAIAIHDEQGKVPVPCATLAVLMLGPGTSISHAAVLTLADTGCLVVWCGEQGVRFYAQGMGETRSAAKVLHQACLCCDPALRLQVVRNMYLARFTPGELDPSLTIQQLRGREGIRVRETYVAASKETGVAWHGRNYDRSQWTKADSVNRALSVANSCLYGICHAAIVSGGYSPALGFIHTGKQLSFVYDIADLYKADVTIPLAFQAAAAGPNELDRRVRLACRDAFKGTKILARILPDIDRILTVSAAAPLPDNGAEEDEGDYDADAAAPGPLWDPHEGTVPGGQSFGEDDADPEAPANTHEQDTPPRTDLTSGNSKSTPEGKSETTPKSPDTNEEEGPERPS